MRLLLLSDIHFVSQAGSPRDINGELRAGLTDCLSALVDEAPIDAILVCGDLAFSGSATEYQRARGFLASLAGALNVRSDEIFVVPGNHDIDWGVTDLEAQRALRTRLRDAGTDDARDAALEKALADPETSAALFEPLANYLDFALAYDCPSSAAAPHWKHSLLFEGFELAMTGANTVLVSHRLDAASERVAAGVGQPETEVPSEQRLLFGRFQAPESSGASTVQLVMAHHPREWVFDADRLWKRFGRRAQLLVTGHTHAFEVIKTEAGGWLRSGALQPPRSEPAWSPGFCVSRIRGRGLRTRHEDSALGLER